MKKLEQVYQIVGGAFIVAAMLVIVGNIITRSIFNAPIKGSYELTGFCTLLFGSSAIAMGMLAGTTISVDVLTTRLKGKTAMAFEYLGRLFNILLFAVYSWTAAKYAVQMIATGELSDTLKIPIYPLRLYWALCAVAIAILELIKMLKIKEKYRLKPEESTAEEEQET